MEKVLFINGEEQAVDDIIGKLSTKIVRKKMVETKEKVVVKRVRIWM